MKLNQRYLFLLFALSFFSCEERKVPFQLNNCKTMPPFIRKLSGFNPHSSYFSTSDIRKMGLVLIEPDSKQGSVPHMYQHTSWKKGGWLAPIVLDEAGNIYSAPAPFINPLDNPIKDQNTIYWVNGQSGEMNTFLRLPMPDTVSTNNAYGIIGMLYLCETGTLYVSTVLGSDRHVQRGGLYAIDIKNKKIIDKITGWDIMGLGISYASGKRQLFFGDGRSSNIYSVNLNKSGNIIDPPVIAFSLDDLGPRGDDKVRRIMTDDNGNLEIHAIEFNYNLIAPREKQEATYFFIYDVNSNKWSYSTATPSHTSY